jgi:hypothetical protein
MAAKADYLEGIFVFTCSSPKRAYVGKSKGVGVAKRVAKSKLKKGNFHNQEAQKDFDENPENFDLVGQMFLLDGNPYDCQTLSELADEIRWKYIEKNYLLWNDIQVVEGKEKEVDRFGLDDLKNSERSVVESIIHHIKSGKIKAQNLSDLLESWGL